MVSRRLLSIATMLIGMGIVLTGSGVAAGAPADPAGASRSAVAGLSETTRIPRGFSDQVLAQGREIYSDLQVGYRAALVRDAITVRLTLADARRKLAELGAPDEARALRAQMQIIRHDLEDQTKRPDQTLWATAGAELEDLLIAAPGNGRTRARGIFDQARSAATAGERDRALKKVDDLLSVVEYKIEAFPLQRVSEDVQSAWQAAELVQPDWVAVQQALKSSLAQLHWLTRVHARGLLMAFYDVSDAAVVFPRERAEARNDLKKASSELGTLPGSEALSKRLRVLADEPDLAYIDISDMLSTLRREILAWQRRAEQDFGPPAATTT